MKQISLLKAMYLTHKAGKMSTPERMRLQQHRLQDLVFYAKENSPYYAELYKDVGEAFSLTDLPTTNKVALMEHFDSWMTDRSITRKKVDNFMADISNVGKKMDGKYLIYTTSGSTGNPCIVLYDETTIIISYILNLLYFQWFFGFWGHTPHQFRTNFSQRTIFNLPHWCPVRTV